ncbi:zinc-dependent alcohol dehydrogenase family protein [Oceanobacillus halophilus]|uniref:Theronine dehydrogenase n=1 Tax=Oceanobacillus halophilus TaxID=930130 RepID=A0A494ZVE7_9BACI|nr:zinc-dependent alcohol dehydrogenase family protein [Oceanobacillus halophilus]RKQ30262.1 theronine dehydrogenase [Oceanobacillus halophilus]
MKALVLTEKEKMSVQEVEQPTIHQDEVLVNVKYCGICGTDVHIFHGEPGSAEVTPPITLGHEFSGEVVAVGEEVTTIQVGDHVAVDPNSYCGKCDYCRQGRVQLCDNLSAIGVTRNGGMAEYCAVPEANCLKLPNTIPLKAGALVEPLSCVLHGFDQIKGIKPYSKVLIIGGGFIGSLFLQTVRLKNPYQIDVCEIDTKKHEQLLALGADQTYTNRNEFIGDYDLVIECVGRKETIETAIGSAAKGAEVLLFGVPSPTTAINIAAYDIFRKELNIHGSFINPFTLQDSVHLLGQEKLDVLSLISHTLSLEEVPEVLANYPRHGITKAIIKI